MLSSPPMVISPSAASALSSPRKARGVPSPISRTLESQCCVDSGASSPMSPPFSSSAGSPRRKQGFQEVSSLSVESCEGEFLIITVFEIRKEEVPSFIERENEFRFLAVVPESLDGISLANPAVVCARYSDDEYFHIRCKGSKETFFQHYGQYNIHKIWRDDIFPCRAYLRHCVLAAKNLGEAAYGNFLDHTFIGDRKTTIRQYLASAGSGIMEEEPPESLKSRYGG